MTTFLRGAPIKVSAVTFQNITKNGEQTFTPTGQSMPFTTTVGDLIFCSGADASESGIYRVTAAAWDVVLTLENMTIGQEITGINDQFYILTDESLAINSLEQVYAEYKVDAGLADKIETSAINEELIPNSQITSTLIGSDISINWPSQPNDKLYTITYTNGSGVGQSANVYTNSFTISDIDEGISYAVYVKRMYDNIKAVYTFNKPSSPAFNASAAIITSDAIVSNTGSVKVVCEDSPFSDYRLYYQEGAAIVMPEMVEVRPNQVVGGFQRFNAEKEITEADRTDNLITYTCANHGLAGNPTVCIEGFSDDSFNSIGAIVHSIPDADTFTVYSKGESRSLTETASLKTYKLYSFSFQEVDAETTFAVSSLTRSSNISTITLSAPQALLVNDVFELETTDANFQSGFKVITAVASTTEFSFADAGIDATATESVSVHYAAAVGRVDKYSRVSSYILPVLNTAAKATKFLSYCENIATGFKPQDFPFLPSFYFDKSGRSYYPNYLYYKCDSFDKELWLCGFSPQSNSISQAFYDPDNYVQSMLTMPNHDTPNSLTLSDLTYYNITVDDNAGQGAENSGESLCSSTGTTAITGTVYYRFSKALGVQTAGSAVAQYDIPTGVTSRGVRGIFWGVRNQFGRAVKVFVTNDNIVSWINNGTQYSYTFAELGIGTFVFDPLSPQNNYSCCDGVNKMSFGNLTSAWLLTFDWRTNAVTAQTTPRFTPRLFPTEESSIQLEMECVNGRAIWLQNVLAPSNGATGRTVTMRLGGSVDDPQSATIFAPVDHSVTFQPLNIGAGGAALPGAQYGMSLFAGQDATGRVRFLDAEHDSTSTIFTYGGTPQDTHTGVAYSNIKLLEDVV